MSPWRGRTESERQRIAAFEAGSLLTAVCSALNFTVLLVVMSQPMWAFGIYIGVVGALSFARLMSNTEEESHGVLER